MLAGGYFGCAFDTVMSATHDALTSQGLRLLLDAVTCIRKFGMCWLATPCSSFTVLCRAQSKRMASNSFLGEANCYEYVKNGNFLLEISALIFFFVLLIVSLGDIGATQKFVYACLPIFKRSSVFHPGNPLQDIYGRFFWAIRKTFAAAVNLVRHQRTGKRKAIYFFWAPGDPLGERVHRAERLAGRKPNLYPAIWSRSVWCLPHTLATLVANLIQTSDKCVRLPVKRARRFSHFYNDEKNVLSHAAWNVYMKLAKMFLLECWNACLLKRIKNCIWFRRWGQWHRQHCCPTVSCYQQIFLVLSTVQLLSGKGSKHTWLSDHV